MKNVLTYKECIGSVQLCAEDDVFYGKIEGIDDLISFEGSSVAELKSSFEEAVDDYLEICAKAGKSAVKSYKGSFNVRIPPEIHKKAALIAVSQGISLNHFIQKAVEHEILHEEQPQYE